MTYVFEDERWIRKVLIAALLALGPVIVIGIFPLLGYVTEIVRRVSSGADQRLPEWDGRFGAYFKDGIAVAIGLLFWWLPTPVVWLVVGVALAPTGLGAEIGFGLGSLVLANLYAALVFPSVIGRFATTGRFSSMFEFGAVFDSIRNTGGGFLGVWVVQLLVLLLTFATIWLVITIIFATAYSAMVFGHAYGQAARLGSGQAPLVSARPTS